MLPHKIEACPRIAAALAATIVVVDRWPFLAWTVGILGGLLWISVAQVGKRLGRSAITTYARARALGLPCGASQGSEYLSAAAKRTGFDTGQLRIILGAAKVPIRCAMARPRQGASVRNRYHYVDPDDVNAAVERWGRTEVVNAAARARGFDGCTLRDWLIAAGHTPPKQKKARWRVLTSVVDEVVAARRALSSVRAHARRVGLNPVTLAKRLRAAGVLGPKRPGAEVKLADQVVDAALEREAA